jgi:pyranose oxidase
VRWTGPAEILTGGQAAGRLEVLWEHAVRRLDHRGGRVVAAQVADLRSGAATTVRAEAFLVAVGGIRTPALLWASGIAADGADAPLGRYLSDHPLAYAQLVLNPEALGSPARDSPASGPETPGPAARAGAGPDPDPVVLLPMSAARPFHALLQCDAYDVRVLEGRIDSRLLLSLYWYTSAEPRFENRVVFSHEATDAFGLPQPTFEYRLSADERDRQQAAVDDLRAVGQRLGTFLPGSPPRLLSPGSSLHVMGTTRMGQADDGQSVTDLSGRVWGFDNLYLGGTGLIPSATTTNPTLTACALAIRAAAAITGAAIAGAAITGR